MATLVDPTLTLTLNQVESISNEFRVFPMEILAGESDLVTSVKENGATFKLDYGEAKHLHLPFFFS